MNGKNKQNTAINVNTESNNNWKSRSNNRSYSVIVFVLIISFIIPFFSPFFSFESKADYDYSVSDNGHIDEYFTGKAAYLIGGALAKLGYALDGTSNAQFASNILTNQASKLLTDDQLAIINPNYTAGTDAYNSAVLTQLAKNGEIIVDQNNDSIQLSASMCQVLKDYMNTEVEPDYKLFKIPGIKSINPVSAPYQSLNNHLYWDLSENCIGMYSTVIKDPGTNIENWHNYQGYFSLSDNYLACGSVGINDAYNNYSDLYLALTRGYYNGDWVANYTYFNVYSQNTLNYIYSDFTDSLIHIKSSSAESSSRRTGQKNYFRTFTSTKNYVTYLYANKDMYVPVFKDSTAFFNYIRGYSELYQFDSGYQGGDITIDPSVDPQEIYNAISNAIKDAGLNDSSAVQELIQKIASEYIKSIADATYSTSVNTAKIAKDTAGILDASKSMLVKLDNIYSELKNFHSDNKTILNNIYDYIKGNKNSPSSNGTGLSEQQARALLRLDDNVDQITNVFNKIVNNSHDDDNFTNIVSINKTVDLVFSPVTQGISVNYVDKGNDLDDTIRYVVQHQDNEFKQFDKNFQELIKTNSNKFPVSIPSDMYFIYSMFSAKPEAPVFDCPISYNGIAAQSITIDMSGWTVLSKISRSFFTILFIAALIPLTFKILDYNDMFFKGGD